MTAPTATEGAIRETVERGVHRLTLARPESGNRLTLPMLDHLAARITAAGRDAAVVVLDALGDDFCLGREPGPLPAATAEEMRRVLAGPILGVYAAIRSCPAPVVAVVAGRASGFGCALVGACDLTFAREDASFNLPEMEKDLPPTLALSALIGRVPAKRLAHLVFGGAWIDARAAETLGLVGEVMPTGGFTEAVEARLEWMRGKPAAALACVKEYMLLAPRTDERTSARLASSMLTSVLASR